QADPDDDATRLVYADWLEERGDVRGEFLRTEVALRELTTRHRLRGELTARLEALLPRIDREWLARVERSDRYTMLWPADLCRQMEQSGELGRPLRFVWGGSNQQTRFSSMSVRAGDYLYPLRVRSHTLYVIARM